MLATIAAISAAVGIVSGCLAIFFAVSRLNTARRARLDVACLNAQLSFRNELIAAGDEKVVTLGHEDALATDSANALFRSAMSGADAKALAGAVTMLINGGRPFRMAARVGQGCVSIRGSSVADRPVIFIRPLASADASLDFSAALDAAPMPVWLRGPDLKLRWANKAFLDAVDARDLESAIAANFWLGQSESELSAAVRDGAGRLEAKRYVTFQGRRHALSIRHEALPDSTVAGFASDITELAQAEARIQLNADADHDLLNGIPYGVAIFDADQCLQGYNAAFASLWTITESWLDEKPTFTALLDHLREFRQLPEQQNFRQWRAQLTRLFEECSKPMIDMWHLPDGRSLKIAVRPHLLGGLVFLFEDVSEKFRLEASLKLLTQVQRATLDTVEDGMAVFGPDGRLLLHNTVFARQWQLAESELANQPTLARVAQLAESRLGPDGLWRIVAAGVTSDEPERCNEWAKATRTDGRIIALSMRRLPHGATAVTFCDLTDAERFKAESSPHVAA